VSVAVSDEADIPDGSVIVADADPTASVAVRDVSVAKETVPVVVSDESAVGDAIAGETLSTTRQAAVTIVNNARRRWQSFLIRRNTVISAKTQPLLYLRERFQLISIRLPHITHR
jgi:hypothetical protein